MKKSIVLIIYMTCTLYGETINGHILPPEPYPKANNATLLGIDSNNNGVRDDVERWIYKTYYTHPIEIGLFMQCARAYQKVMNISMLICLEDLKKRYNQSNSILLKDSWHMKNIKVNSVETSILYYPSIKTNANLK